MTLSWLPHLRLSDNSCKMARNDVLRILPLLLSMLSLDSCLCTHSDEFYDRYGLDAVKICHLYHKKKTNEITNNAVIVESKYKFDRWFVTVDFHCKFVFKAPKGDGLFGVIQKLSLRKNSTHCIDYVQFRRKDHHPTEKFCGTLDRSKLKYYPVLENNVLKCGPPMSLSTYAEYDPSEGKAGELETEIFVSKERLNEGESLALSIVYTPYKDCSTADPEKYKSFGHKSCVRKEYFNDGIYNCVPHVCSDEVDCRFWHAGDTTEIISNSTGTKVTVAAVTTMILIFVVFIICVWICKKSHKLCWALDFARPNACSRPGPTTQESERTVSPPSPTAPMFEVAVPPSVADKDLPPSYDSLFPESSTTVRS